MLTYEFIHPQQQIESADFKFVESFLKSTGRTKLGWHYITDITWIYSQVKTWPRELRVLDAGGGSGPLQFLLAELGFNVTNIDLNLPSLVPTYQRRYQTDREILESFTPTSYNELLELAVNSSPISEDFKSRLKSNSLYKLLKSSRYNRQHDRWRKDVGLSDIPVGKIKWCVGNLCHIPEIPSDSFGAVVSLSSLEHVPNDYLDGAMTEIHRVLKSSARWAVTTSGTEKPSTWFHEPSQGLCFSVNDLENRFGAEASKSQQPDKILDEYRNCSYLEKNLAEFYKSSGKFGMPWGIWNPQYIPVGLSK